MSEQLERLLALQAIDTAIDQHRHRRVNLPERADLAARLDELAALEKGAASTQQRRDELERAQSRIEDEIALLADKTKQVDRQLYSGTVSAMRELQALQDEIAALGRRQRTLEDEALELMVESEPLDTELGVIDDRRKLIDAAAMAVTATIVEAESAIDAEVAALEAQRAETVGLVGATLLEEYETLRKRLGGIAVARLIGSRCDGCHLTLPAVEVDTIKHAAPDELVHCSECGRLLVRSTS
jgi:uncharacterized protein